MGACPVGPRVPAGRQRRTRASTPPVRHSRGRGCDHESPGWITTSSLPRAELHIAINSGVTIEECVAHARSRVPFWTDSTMADVLADRGANPLLRSYLWGLSGRAWTGLPR